MNTSNAQPTRSGVFIVKFECISHIFFSVPMVDFQHVNFCWVGFRKIFLGIATDVNIFVFFL